MSHKPGTNLGGIRSVGDIKDRCYVDPEIGCWHWRQYKDKDGQPILRVAQTGKNTTAGSALLYFARKERPKGFVNALTCSSPDCCSPHHRKLMHVRDVKQNKPPLHADNVRIARRRSAKCNDAMVADIRASDKLLKELAAEHGIAISTVGRIRRGEAWRPLGSSVFNWRP